MKNSLFIPVVAGLLLLSLAAPAAQALWMNPADILYAAITMQRPGYQDTAQDYLKRADFYKGACEKSTSLYNERMRAYVREEAALQNAQIDLRSLDHPTAAQRSYIMSTGFHQRDPDAAGYWETMMGACDAAQKNYNKALQMTKDDDYAGQAAIFDAGAGVYDSLGMTTEAGQTRAAADVARAHAAASDIFLPLSPLTVIAGVLGALFLALRKKG
jgi:hypothetical protein